MTESFKQLREQSKKHSIQETNEIIKNNDVQEIDFTSDEPVASGVFGQVNLLNLGLQDLAE